MIPQESARGLKEKEGEISFQLIPDKIEKESRSPDLREIFNKRVSPGSRNIEKEGAVEDEAIGLQGNGKVLKKIVPQNIREEVLEVESSGTSEDENDTSIIGNPNPEDSAIYGDKADRFEETGLTPNLAEFLKIKVSFAGQNIEKSLRKVVSFARTILEQPKLLMIYEEALSWGNDISSNLDILRARSPDTTVLAITQSNKGVLSYDQVLLLDGGMIIDQGDPVELIKQEQSHFYNYLKETDRDMFMQLRSEIEEREQKGMVHRKKMDEKKGGILKEEDSPRNGN